MIQSDGITILVDVLRPNFFSIPIDSYAHLTISEFVILLLNRMVSLSRETKITYEMPIITHNTLELVSISLLLKNIIVFYNAVTFCRTILYNIKTETEKNDSIDMRNDYCYILNEIIDNCSIDGNEYSNNIVTGTTIKLN